jgi:hypothetical protein
LTVISSVSRAQRRLWGLGALCLAAALSWSALALAAKPVAHTRYSGTLNALRTEKVTFRVDRKGTTVTGFKVTPYFPSACSSGGPPPTYRSKPAKIKHGRFSTRVWVINSGGNRVPAGKAHGRFLSNGRERGSVKPVDVPARCVKSFAYTTKAKG